MRRTLAFAAVVLALGIAGGAGPARAETKLGYINSELVMEQAKEAQAALAGFNRDVEGWNQEAIQRRKDLDDLARDLAQQAPMLSEEKRREKEQDHQRKLTEYDQFVQSVWGPGGLVVKRNEEVLRPIVAKIQVILGKFGADEGFDIIFDAADGNVLYADQTLDLTTRVVEQLNADQP
jgi:outer membrane protein